MKKKLSPSVNKEKVIKQNYEKWLSNEENFDLKSMRMQRLHTQPCTDSKKVIHLLKIKCCVFEHGFNNYYLETKRGRKKHRSITITIP